MHVNCPTCATTYDIPSLERPRRLRCAQCDTEWREVPAGSEPATVATEPEAIAAPLPERPAPSRIEAPEPAMPLAEMERLVGPMEVARWPTQAVSWSVLWVLSLLLITGGLAALWHWRVAIGHDWPPSQRLYGWVGGLVAGRPPPGGR